MLGLGVARGCWGLGLWRVAGGLGPAVAGLGCWGLLGCWGTAGALAGGGGWKRERSEGRGLEVCRNFQTNSKEEIDHLAEICASLKRDAHSPKSTGFTLMKPSTFPTQWFV